ncbi:MAG: RHS repeat-associated core domain-containing protein, partial [Pyrinomonadaceae bacterium]
DAENHQKEVKDASNVTIGQYLYDGEGKRVKKISNTETTVFVYNANGQLVAEYSTALAQVQQVSYLTTDHLGSPRVTTNEDGLVTGRKDYSAFGEESFSSQRTSSLGYTGGGELRKGYTGYEKDSESGLDFAQARYYNSTHGRYTSVDPLTASASIRNPQTFNRYSYVLNSPYKFTDPLGLIPVTTGACGGSCPNSGPTVDGSSIRGRDATWDWANSLPENEIVSVGLNIVYDTAQFSRMAARTILADTITNLRDTFDAINVEFDQTFTPGSAKVAQYNNPECGNCAYQIVKGGINGAINVFLHNNSKYTSPISQFIPENQQIFLENVAGTKFSDKLAVEVGHLFRYFVNGNPRSGRIIRARNSAGGIVDSADVTETAIVRKANKSMRHGGIRYGKHYVDDFRDAVHSTVTPGRTANILGSLSPRKPRSPTHFDIYRLGARMVAAQR